MVARVVLLARGASADGLLGGRLDSLGTREEASEGNARLEERRVVRTEADLRRLVGEPASVVEVLVERLDCG